MADAVIPLTKFLDDTGLPSRAWRLFLLNLANLATAVGILPVASGGTGTATPGIVAGMNVTVTGSFPNQTVNATGTVTHTAGALTANALVVGNGGADTKALGSLGTTTTVYHGNAAGAGSFGPVSLATDVTGFLGTHGRAVAQTGAVASVVTTTVGASDGSYIISANVLVTTSTLHSFSCACSYTDEGGSARVLTLNFSQITGAFVTTLTNALGAGAYEGVPLHIRAKASTTITVATSGTFTTVVYNVESHLTQIA